MHKILPTICLLVFALAAGTIKTQAQTTPILDTIVADGYLSIIAPTCNNFIKLLEIDKKQFENALLKHQYQEDEDGGEGSYKIESFQASYTISKAEKEVEFYFSTFVGSLKAMKADVLKRYPKAKITGEETETTTYEFDTKDATGQHSYLLTIDSNNGKKVFVNIIKLL